MQSIKQEINWCEFLAKNDMKWDNLPTSWLDGAFIGNGLIGSIFWKDEKGNLRFEVSRTDFYDHRYNEFVVHFGEVRLPNGHFELNLDNQPIEEGSLRLDLYNAQVIGEIKTKNSKTSLRTFTHATNDVIVIELDNQCTNTNYNWSFYSDVCKSTRPTNIPDGYIEYPTQTQTVVDGVNVSVQSMPDDEIYKTKGKGEGQVANAWKVVDRANKSYLYISMVFSYHGTFATGEAVANVKNAINQDFDVFTKTHQNWWHEYYSKSFVSVPDAKLESYYWVQMYKLASATREDKPVLDLMGPWFRPTVWPAIWWNLNIQLTYWAVYVSNHCEFGNALVNLLHDNKKMLSDNCELDRDDVYAIGRASSHTLLSPVGLETGNLAYALNNAWQQYLYTMDDDMLREKLLPLMIGSLKYILTVTYKKPNDEIHLKPTASPEYTDSVENCNYTLSLMRWLARSIIWSNKRLNINDEFDDICSELLEKLVEYQIDETGIMIGKDMPLEKSHRHWSHLFMIYPLYEYTFEDESKKEIIEKSLKHWLSKDEYFVGYSWFAAASMYAMMGEGDRAIECIYKFHNDKIRCCPNTMYVEGPMHPVIETPLFSARTLQDMLLTSYNGIIRIFPALPTSWKDAQFYDFRAEGAFLVSAKMKNGVLEFAQIESLKGERCKVKKACFDKFSIIGDREFKVTNISEDVFEIDIKKGECIIIR